MLVHPRVDCTLEETNSSMWKAHYEGHFAVETIRFRHLIVYPSVSDKRSLLWWMRYPFPVDFDPYPDVICTNFLALNHLTVSRGAAKSG